MSEAQFMVKAQIAVASTYGAGTAQFEADGKPLDDTLENPRATALKTAMAAHLIGHEEAVEKIVARIEAWATGLAKKGRTIGNFLLLGPPGAGKTQTITALVRGLAQNGEINVNDFAIIIDGNEYQLDFNMTKLIGAPPGYKGFAESTPELNQPRFDSVKLRYGGKELSIVFLDESEKFHPEIRAWFLGPMGKGAAKTNDASAHNEIDFQNTIVFWAGNLGAEEAEKAKRGFGFESGKPGTEAERDAKRKQVVQKALKGSLLAELIDRFDEIILYKALDPEQMKSVLRLEITAAQKRVAEVSPRGKPIVQFSLSPEAEEWVLQQGIVKGESARHLTRTIDQMIIQPLARMIGAGTVQPGQWIQGTIRPGRPGRLTWIPLASSMNLAEQSTMTSGVYGFTPK